MINFISYRTQNTNYNYFLRFVLLFILVQLLIGFLFFQKINFDSKALNQIWIFLRNIITLSIYIYLFIGLLNQAKLSHTLFKKVYSFLWIYFIISFCISCFIDGTPYTIFSYFGKLLNNILLHNYYCDALCATFKILIYGNNYI